MPLSPDLAKSLIADRMWPAFQNEKDRLDRIDLWHRWEHDRPHNPRQSTKEYKELAARAITPWLSLVVNAVTQMLYVEGYRASSAIEDAPPWDYWQANGLDSRQMGIHRAAVTYGLSYATVLPGESFIGEPMPVVRGVSPRRIITFYEDPCEDDWPVYALRCEPEKVNGAQGWSLRLYDDTAVYRFTSGATGDGLEYRGSEVHGAGVCPVVRFANQLDLEGRASGEVEPYIAVAGRIDQTSFDRLVVQRFSSWVVRTISGMSPPETTEQQDETAAQAKLRLRVEDILIAEDPDTKFGSLPATSLNGFIDAHESDVRSLAAVTQTPPHHLLGQMANLSAEALTAAESSLNRKVEERKHSFGESWEQVLRLAASIMGDTENAQDISAQVRWRDMESRSMAQTADALGKLATMLGVPVQMLWEKVPGFTQQDVETAKTLAAEGDAFSQLTQMLDEQMGATEPASNGNGALV